jgi:hypothetical protein
VGSGSSTVSNVAARLPEGAYDELITEGLAALFDGQEEIEGVDAAELTEVLAAHLEKVATRALDAMPVDRRMAVANRVLKQLGESGDSAFPRLVRRSSRAFTL